MASPSPRHPPTNITVAACDYLRPQGQAYAEALRLAGVKVTEDILPGVPHGFTFAPNADVTKRWLERQVESFATAFGLA
jgi:acetyl esterase/lipase